MWNLVVSKPEHHNLRRKTAIKSDFDIENILNNIKYKRYKIKDRTF